MKVHLSTVQIAFFGNAGLVYWDLTLPMFELQLRNIVYDPPQGQVGFGGNEGNPSLLVRDDQRMTLYEKALGVGWLMESFREVPRAKSLGPAAPQCWPWDFPRDSIHHSNPLAFPNNVPVFCQPYVYFHTTKILFSVHYRYTAGTSFHSTKDSLLYITSTLQVHLYTVHNTIFLGTTGTMQVHIWVEQGRMLKELKKKMDFHPLHIEFSFTKASQFEL